MSKSGNKKINFIFLIITIMSLHSSLQPHWHDFITNYSTALCISAIIAACIIGKISHNRYLEYRWPNTKIIEHCRTIYSHIYTDVQTCYYTYKSDSQLSDVDLKALITRTRKPYPFIAYKEQITIMIFKLIKYNILITQELTRIDAREKQLSNNSSEESMLIAEEFIQLKARGKTLQKYIETTYAILSALKNKVVLFKEYESDYQNWSYTQQKKLRNYYCNASLRRSSRSRERSASIISSKSPSIT